MLQHIKTCNLLGGKSKSDILRNIRGKYQKSGMASFEVPVEEGMDPKFCTEWRLVKMPKEIMAYLLARI
jgi:hypothetical protein